MQIKYESISMQKMFKSKYDATSTNVHNFKL